MILELWMPIRKKGRISISFLSVHHACMYLNLSFPPGNKKKKETRKINPNTNDVCYAQLFTSWSPNAVRSSVRSISDHHNSKISPFQDRSLSWTQGKTSFVSMWSQDEERSLWDQACCSRHSLWKFSSLKCKPSRISGLDVDPETFAASGHDEFGFHVCLDVGLPHRVLKVKVQGALTGHTAVAVAPSGLAVGEPVVRGARVPASLPAQTLLLHEKLQPFHLAARGPVLRLTHSITGRLAHAERALALYKRVEGLLGLRAWHRIRQAR